MQVQINGCSSEPQLRSLRGFHDSQKVSGHASTTLLCRLAIRTGFIFFYTCSAFWGCPSQYLRPVFLLGIIHGAQRTGKEDKPSGKWGFFSNFVADRGLISKWSKTTFFFFYFFILVACINIVIKMDSTHKKYT